MTICEDAWQAAGLTPSTYGNDPIENLAKLLAKESHWMPLLTYLHPYHADKVNSRITVA